VLYCVPKIKKSCVHGRDELWNYEKVVRTNKSGEGFEIVVFWDLYLLLGRKDSIGISNQLKLMPVGVADE